MNALLPGAGSFGVTHEPAAVSVGGEVGGPKLSSLTVAETVRNLQTSTFSAAFFDGQHLIVGNGARVLIYNGLPHFADRPSIVLGQPDFDTRPSSTTSASSFGNLGAGGIWSDGTKLVVSNSNRVLVWLSFPTASYAPADVVLGQSDFSSNKANAGGNAGASTLFGAVEVDSDGTRLVVADEWNNRVLEWSKFPTTLGQPADVVIGQPTLASNTAYGGATQLYLPYGVTLNGTSAYVSGYGGPGLRVINAVGQINSPSSEFVFCWPWGADAAPNCAQATRPGGIRRTPGGGVALRDLDMRRILITNAAPSGPSLPSIVVGQPDAQRMVTTTAGDSLQVNGGRVHASTLAGGYDVGGAGDRFACRRRQAAPHLVAFPDLRLRTGRHGPRSGGVRHERVDRLPQRHRGDARGAVERRGLGRDCCGLGHEQQPCSLVSRVRPHEACGQGIRRARPAE